MGKPYQTELAELPKTISWALGVDIGPAKSFIQSARGTPLLATGSGGSLSAAKLASIFHQFSAAGSALSASPLQICAPSNLDHEASFVLFSAGGANKDILSVFKRLASTEPKQLLAITGVLGSPLAALVQKYPRLSCLELPVPSGRDGFLATNSLMAFSVAIARAYASLESKVSTFPRLRALTSDPIRWDRFTKSIEKSATPLWARKHLIVLYSPDLEAAAVDIESKFTEAALGTVQIADYRHFAHGRHHWLAKRGDDSSVLALYSPRYQSLAEKTLEALPRQIPSTSFPFTGDVYDSGVCAMATSIVLAGLAGKQRSIDPGRPGVPQFGRKIYHLSWSLPSAPTLATSKNIQLGVCRKLRSIGTRSDPNMELPNYWIKAGHEFCRRLASRPCKAVVLDFDGTLVFTEKRFEPISTKISSWLLELLRRGLTIGVASGRGKSLRIALRNTIPRKYWDCVVVGYYNGAQLGLLSGPDLPKVLPTEGILKIVHEKFEQNSDLSGLVKIEAGNNQITLVPSQRLSIEGLWCATGQILTVEDSKALKMISSGHSVDILEVNTTKRAVVDMVAERARASVDEVLTIGDKGRWPGNDAELLSQFPSLSVDEVSADSRTCWNLAPAGHVGPDALAAYFSAFAFKGASFHIEPSAIRPARS